jgi:hypothetical protein
MIIVEKEVNSDPRPTFGSDETLEGRIPSLSQCKGCDPGGYGDCSVVGGKWFVPVFGIHS